MDELGLKVAGTERTSTWSSGEVALVDMWAAIARVLASADDLLRDILAIVVAVSILWIVTVGR